MKRYKPETKVDPKELAKYIQAFKKKLKGTKDGQTVRLPNGQEVQTTGLDYLFVPDGKAGDSYLAAVANFKYLASLTKLRVGDEIVDVSTMLADGDIKVYYMDENGNIWRIDPKNPEKPLPNSISLGQLAGGDNGSGNGASNGRRGRIE